MEGPTASPSTTATPELKAPPAVRLHMTLWLCGWLLLVLPAILGRPLLPIDETRYVGVAWEMWHQGEFLVPLLNSEPYSHKPPLLFWFIQLGWSVFGVNELWPRLLPALFSLATVVLTWRVGARLFPQRPGVGLLAGTMLLGSLLWGVFTPALMFDLLLSFWVLLATYGLMCAANGRAMSGWTLVAFATGLGLLAKGPVVLLYTVPLALLVPLGGQHPPALRWYACLAAALLAGTAIALAWAIPAAMRGGPDYAKAIFWSQSADRMVDSFAHRRPLWWYLPLLPLLLFPWLCWPVLWRGLARLLRRPEPAARKVAELQRRDIPVAHIGKHHGGFHFSGRLRAPVTELTEQEAAAWARLHPQGRILAYYREAVPAAEPPPDFVQPFRTRALVIWPAAAWRDGPP